MSNKISSTNKAIVVIIALMIIALTSVIFFSLPIESPQVDYKINQNYDRTISVLATRVNEPLSFADENGKPSGYYVELLYMLADKIGANVDIEFIDNQYINESLTGGAIDLVLGYDIDNVPEGIITTLRFTTDDIAVFGKEKVVDFKEALTKKLAVVKDDFTHNNVVKPYGMESITTLYNSPAEALLSVVNNKNNYAMMRYSLGRRTMAQIGNTSLVSTQPLLLHIQTGFAAPEKNAELVNELNNAFVSLYQNGTINELSDKWLGEYVNILSIKDVIVGEMPTLFSIMIIAFGALTVVYIKRMRQSVVSVSDKLSLQERNLEYYKSLVDYTHINYDSVHEMNLTQNSLSDPLTKKLATRLVNCNGTPSYDETVEQAIKYFVQDKYIPDFVELFNRENLLNLHMQGMNRFYHEIKFKTGLQMGTWKRITTALFDHKLDNSVRMLCLIENIDREKQLTEEASRDSLTRLYNKATTTKLISNIMQESTPMQDTHALFIIDIDNFKTINDTCGHAFGDRVIIMFASVLKRHFRDTDIVGRVGGDEFILCCKNLPSLEWLDEKAQLLSQALNMMVEYDGKTFTTSCSIGISVYFKHGDNFQDLYKNADKALYMTKERGKNGYTILPDDKKD